ncbi:MAG TPA: hypothetical protein VFS91_00065 [Nitrobacter sp.]|nr:hypothetical protein [Nitrobacter sp.]
MRALAQTAAWIVGMAALLIGAEILFARLLIEGGWHFGEPL